MKQPVICVLCNRLLPDGDFGCDPYPVASSGRCCSRCDDLKVTPARLERKGIPRYEAVAFGKCIQRAVKFHRKRLKGKAHGHD